MSEFCDLMLICCFAHTHIHCADKKLPRVAHIEKRVDGLQSILAAQQKQQMYERALVRYPQCRSNVFAPSVYDEAANPIGSDATTAATELELDFVYGIHSGATGSSVSQTSSSSSHSSSNCSNGNSVYYVSTGEVLWFTAALVVLYTKATNTQRYFREHTGEVTSVGVHPNQYIVASGQAGRQTHVLVWNAKDEPLGKRFTCLPGHTVAVRAISFSHDGKLIASLGGDMYNTICIHDWKEQSLLATARGHSFRVHTIAFNPFQAYGRPETRRAKKPGQALHDDEACYTLVSCGVRHIRFWTLSKTEYVAPMNEEKEEFAFHGSTFGSPARLRPPTPHEKMWKLEGNVPSFHGRLDVQDFTCLTFVDDSPPIYMYDEQTQELVATNATDHTLGRIIAGTAKGDLCVFYQPRRSPEPDLAALEKNPTTSTASEVEPAKWWEIPDEYTDAEINALVLERIAFEPTARLVEVVPHDQETGNRFKLTKQAQAELDGIAKLLTLKPNSATLHARLSELKYGGPVAHQELVTQVAFCKKNGLVVSCGGDGRLLLWKCHMQRAVRVPGVNTQGLFTPLLTGTFSEGSHQLVPVDADTTRAFQLPATMPGDPNCTSSSSGTACKPTSLQWKEDGKFVLVGTSSNCLWELNIASGEWRLVFEAQSGAVVACSCHPGREEVATISYDGYLCLWDLKRHCCTRRMHLGSHHSKAVCMQFQPFGDELAIGMSNGELLIVGYHELKVLVKKTIKSHTGSTVDLHGGGVLNGGASCISQLKYCPKGNFLAVGAKDTFVYIYDLYDNYKRLHVCEGHSSAVTQLTWSVDGDLLQSNASDGEVLHWSVSHAKGSIKQITDAFLVRDTQWVQWTCVFGWPTPGIWSEDTTSLVDIAAVCSTGLKASNSSDGTDGAHSCVSGTSPSLSDNSSEDLLAVACKSSVRLFRWPAMRGAKSRNYMAHAATIPSLCFSFDDRYLVSVGGDDGTIVQWKCTAGASSPARRSPSKPSPVARKRPQKGFDDDSDTVFAESTSPVPPPAADKTSTAQRSPRQHARQYRERQDRDDEQVDVSGAGDTAGAGLSDEERDELVEAPSPPPRHSVLFQARAKHDFQAENPDELSIRSGEMLRVLSQENDEWWIGERCDGTRGMFPSTYVDAIARDDDAEIAAEDTEADPLPVPSLRDVHAAIEADEGDADADHAVRENEE